LRGESFLREVLESRMEGNRLMGRPRTGMFDGFMEEEAYSVTKRRAMDRLEGLVAKDLPLGRILQREL